MNRIYNFSAGPAVLPVEVLEEAQRNLVDYQGAGLSIMEASHRGKEYDAVHEEALNNIKKLLNVSDDYAIVFMQGGASAQFAMVPMNLAGEKGIGEYVLTGSWGKKAYKEAGHLIQTRVIADTTDAESATVPDVTSLESSTDASYVHLTSNETISGNQFKQFPKTTAPLVCDMSSDILSRPLDVSQFGIIYAGAQKNMGPSGVTLVIIRKDLLEQAEETVPTIFRYKTHADKNSLYNTPPCFSIYMLSLTTRWMLEQGGLDQIEKINLRKSEKLYQAIDATDFYRGTAEKACRSTMNVTFRLPTEELEATFIADAAEQGLKTLKGHRSVGGIRASIYNAFPEAGVDALIDFMQTFEKTKG